MAQKETGFYKPKSMNVRDRAEMERLRAELAKQTQRADEAEAALVELAELYAEQDDAIVELAGLIE